MNKSFEERVQSVGWSRYSGPEYYSQEELEESLIHLSRNDESRASNGLDNKVLFAVGNNHAGTYYPAILEVADFLIELEESSTNEAVRKCAYAILNDLFYFSPDVGNYTGHSFEEIESFVKEKLSPYADPT